MINMSLSDKIKETDVGLALHPEDVKDAVKELIKKLKIEGGLFTLKEQIDLIKSIFGERLSE